MSALLSFIPSDQQEATAHAVSSMIRESGRGRYGSGWARWWADEFSPAQIERMFRESEHYAIVLNDDGDVAGSGFVRDGEVLAVFVSTDHPRVGLGARIVSWLAERSAVSLSAHIDEGNVPAEHAARGRFLRRWCHRSSPPERARAMASVAPTMMRA